jgi:anti-sigma regulatory factor (Ser/Thr protein kinase)
VSEEQVRDGQRDAVPRALGEPLRLESMFERPRSNTQTHTTLPAEPRSVPLARGMLRHLLSDAGIEGDAQRDGLLVASELVSNAISHGSRPDDEISVAYTIQRGVLSICVRDASHGDKPPRDLSLRDTVRNQRPHLRPLQRAPHLRPSRSTHRPVEPQERGGRDQRRRERCTFQLPILAQYWAARVTCSNAGLLEAWLEIG